MIVPTLSRRDDQTILTQWDSTAGTGLHIGLKAGGFVTVTIGGGQGVKQAIASKAMVERQWYALAVGIDPRKGMARIDPSPIVRYAMRDDRVPEEFSLVSAASRRFVDGGTLSLRTDRSAGISTASSIVRS
jgi:hypothetical protein